MEKVESELTAKKVELKIYKKVNFSGNYYMVSVNQGETQGLEKLLGELLLKLKPRYHYINLGLIISINIGIVIYLLKYFTL